MKVLVTLPMPKRSVGASGVCVFEAGEPGGPVEDDLVAPLDAEGDAGQSAVETGLEHVVKPGGLTTIVVGVAPPGCASQLFGSRTASTTSVIASITSRGGLLNIVTAPLRENPGFRAQRDKIRLLLAPQALAGGN